MLNLPSDQVTGGRALKCELVDLAVLDAHVFISKVYLEKVSFAQAGKVMNGDIQSEYDALVLFDCQECIVGD